MTTPYDPTLPIVVDMHDPAPWYLNWLDGLQAGLQSIGRPYRLVHVADVRAGVDTVGDEGPVILSRFTCYDLLDSHLQRQEGEIGRAVLVEHDAYSPFTCSVGPEMIDLFQHPSVRLVWVGTPAKARFCDHFLRRSPRSAPVRCLGFPYLNPALEEAARALTPWNERPDLVVFPQALRDMNQPYFAVRVALTLIERGYRVVWSTGTYPIPAHFPVAFWRELGIEVQQNDQPALFRLLREARVAVATSTSGSLGLGPYEAYRLGCRVVVPRGEEHPSPKTGEPILFPPYFDLFNAYSTYPAFDRRALLERVLDPRPTLFRQEWLDPTSVAIALPF